MTSRNHSIIPYYYIDICSLGVDGVISINDTELVRLEKGYKKKLRRGVTEWMVCGNNKLQLAELEVWDFQDKENYESENGLAANTKCQILVREGKLDKPASDEDPIIMSLYFQEPIEDPITQKLTEKLITLPYKWKWASAEILQPHQLNDTALIDLVTEIRDQMHDRKFDYLDLMDIKFAELSLCYGKSIDEIKANCRMIHELGGQSSNWKMQPLDRNEFAFKICGYDRMVDIRSAIDNEPLIRSVVLEDDSQIFQPLYISKIDSKWRVVR